MKECGYIGRVMPPGLFMYFVLVFLAAISKGNLFLLHGLYSMAKYPYPPHVSPLFRLKKMKRP